MLVDSGKCIIKIDLFHWSFIRKILKFVVQMLRNLSSEHVVITVFFGKLDLAPAVIPRYWQINR